MPDVLIVKNIRREGPGLIQTVLDRSRIPFKVIELDSDDSLPNPNAFGACIVLGGPDSANDSTQKIQSELKFVRECLDAQIPYLGICLGMQLLAKTAGCKVLKASQPEIGFRDVQGALFDIYLTPEGLNDPLFWRLPEVTNVFQLHGETVELCEGIRLLGKGARCRNQIIKAGPRAYGIQYHFEVNEAMLDVWIKKDKDLLKLDANELWKDYRTLKKDYDRYAGILIENFLSVSGLLSPAEKGV